MSAYTEMQTNGGKKRALPLTICQLLTGLNKNCRGTKKLRLGKKIVFRRKIGFDSRPTFAFSKKPQKTKKQKWKERRESFWQVLRSPQKNRQQSRWRGWAVFFLCEPRFIQNLAAARAGPGSKARLDLKLTLSISKYPVLSFTKPRELCDRLKARAYEMFCFKLKEGSMQTSRLTKPRELCDWLKWIALEIMFQAQRGLNTGFKARQARH